MAGADFSNDVWQAANTNKKKLHGKDVLDRQEFINFFRMLTKRTDLEEIFLRYKIWFLYFVSGVKLF